MLCGPVAGLQIQEALRETNGSHAGQIIYSGPCQCRMQAVDKAAADGLNSIMSDEPIKGPASYFPSIEKKYGRPIAEWQDMVRARGPAKHMELVEWLKQEHGMGHGHANALVAATLAK